jgi:hypothetical protein
MLGPAALLTAPFATPAAAPAAEPAATPSTLTSASAAAKTGDTVRLASGSYGTFHGAVKSGTVTVKPAAGAAATMAGDFDPAANVRLDDSFRGQIDDVRIYDRPLDAAAIGRDMRLPVRRTCFRCASIPAGSGQRREAPDPRAAGQPYLTPPDAPREEHARSGRSRDGCPRSSARRPTTMDPGGTCR